MLKLLTGLSKAMFKNKPRAISFESGSSTYWLVYEGNELLLSGEGRFTTRKNFIRLYPEKVKWKIKRLSKTDRFNYGVFAKDPIDESFMYACYTRLQAEDYIQKKLNGL